MKALTDILDLAIDSLQRGEPIETILAAYPAHAEELRALLGAAASLDALPAVRFPSAQAMRADRNDFLLEVALLQVEPVSAGPLNRLKQWMVHLQSWQFPIPPIQRRERWKMSTVVVTMTLLVALLVGSVGGVTAMTSDLLPDSPLYGVKLFAEEATLIFTPDPERRAEQHLAMAQARLREIQQMAVAGEVPDDGTLARLEQHFELALRYAEEMDDDAERAFLVRTRAMVAEQTQLMVGLEAATGEPVRVALRATERVLNRTGAEIDARLEGGPGEPVREQMGVGPTPEAPMTPSLVPPRFRTDVVCRRRPPSPFAPHVPLRVYYIGQLYPWKGADVLVEAMRRVQTAELVVVGGLPPEPDLDRLKRFAAELGVEDRVALSRLPASAGASRRARPGRRLRDPSPRLRDGAAFHVAPQALRGHGGEAADRRFRLAFHPGSPEPREKRAPRASRRARGARVRDREDRRRARARGPARRARLRRRLELLLGSPRREAHGVSRGSRPRAVIGSPPPPGSRGRLAGAVRSSTLSGTTSMTHCCPFHPEEW